MFPGYAEHYIFTGSDLPDQEIDDLLAAGFVTDCPDSDRMDWCLYHPKHWSPSRDQADLTYYERGFKALSPEAKKFISEEG